MKLIPVEGPLACARCSVSVQAASPSKVIPALTAASDRASRLRRSLKRLGYELVEAEAGQFYIRRQGCMVNETADLFGLDLAGVEAWIREQVHAP